VIGRLPAHERAGLTAAKHSMSYRQCSELERISGGFAMAEGPRWHDGAVILNDIHADAIKRVDDGGAVSTVFDLPSSPICIGFLSDDTMLVSSLKDRCIWRIAGGLLTTYADFSGLSPFNWGDLVIDDHDRVYVANQGMCYPDNVPDQIDSQIYLLAPGGSPRVVAGDYLYANGLAISPDGRALVVAETFGHRLWRTPIQQDGTLGERELIIQFPDTDRPDGICCDAEGGIWSANATARSVVRCTFDGTITDRISTADDLAIGCILGGQDGRDLYITTAPTADRERARALRASTLWRVRVDVPAGGKP
jgi:sugar lactone lactonase YvrE